jgi:hypothetical protein
LINDGFWRGLPRMAADGLDQDCRGEMVNGRLSKEPVIAFAGSDTA